MSRVRTSFRASYVTPYGFYPFVGRHYRQVPGADHTMPHYQSLSPPDSKTAPLALPDTSRALMVNLWIRSHCEPASQICQQTV